MNRQYLGTIDEDAVRRGYLIRATCAHCGRGGERVHVTSAIGPLQYQDIGKRVYDTGDGVIQVENNEQRDRRLAKG